MAFKAVEIGRPDSATLDRAIADYAQASASGSGQAMMNAALVIIGEACAQLDTEKKSREEVIASLGARGLHPDVASALVDKAAETVSCKANSHSELAPGQTTGGLGVGHFAVIIVVAAIVAYLIFRN